jgi:small multidrug resistance family-3 protein
MLKSIGLFVLSGFAETGGGYLVWLWLRDSRALWFGLIGGVLLILHSVIATFQAAQFFASTPPTAACS